MSVDFKNSVGLIDPLFYTTQMSGRLHPYLI